MGHICYGLLGLLILSGCGTAVGNIEEPEDKLYETSLSEISKEDNINNKSDINIKDDEIEQVTSNINDNKNHEFISRSNGKIQVDIKADDSTIEKNTSQSNEKEYTQTSNKTSTLASTKQKPYPPERLDSFEYKGAKLGGINTDINVHYGLIEKYKLYKQEKQNKINSLNQKIDEKQKQLEEMEKVYNDPSLREDYNKKYNELKKFRTTFYEKYPSYPQIDNDDLTFTNDQKTLLALEDSINTHKITILDREITNLRFNIKELKNDLNKINDNDHYQPIDYDFEIELSYAIIDYLLDNYRYD